MDDNNINLSNLPTPNADLRKNIPIESIISLRKKQLSMSQIAKILGCSKPNIVMRLKKIGYELDRLDDFKDSKADLLELELQKNIQSITPADRKKASYKDRVVSMGVLIDKIQVLTGKPTSFIVYADMIRAKSSLNKDKQDLQQSRDEIVQELKQLESDNMSNP